MKKILVADDEPRQVDGLLAGLRSRYEVEYVDDGRKAIERIAQGGLDAAVLDWSMAPKDVDELSREAQQFYGDKVAAKARELHPNLVLVLRTSASLFSDWKLEENKVHYHNKRNGDALILQYLREQLGE